MSFGLVPRWRPVAVFKNYQLAFAAGRTQSSAESSQRLPTESATRLPQSPDYVETCSTTNAIYQRSRLRVSLTIHEERDQHDRPHPKPLLVRRASSPRGMESTRADPRRQPFVRDWSRAMSGLVQDAEAVPRIGRRPIRRGRRDTDASLRSSANLTENGNQVRSGRQRAVLQNLVSARETSRARNGFGTRRRFEFSVRLIEPAYASEHLNRIFERF